MSISGLVTNNGLFRTGGAGGVDGAGAPYRDVLHRGPGAPSPGRAQPPPPSRSQVPHR